VETTGMEETGSYGPSVYLWAWGDYDRHTLKLTEVKEEKKSSLYEVSRATICG
jgi:hypothetical protein